MQRREQHEKLVRCSTFAQNDDYNLNNSIAKNLLIAIDYARKNPASDNAISDLAKDLNDFLNKTKIGRITGKITVTPQTGNAPLAVTFHAENVVDPSGVTVPKSNYIWSIRGANDTRVIIGTGPSVMYKFQDENTLKTRIREKLSDDMADEAKICFEFATEFFKEMLTLVEYTDE